MEKEEKLTEVKAEYCHPALEVIEKERKGFLSVYKKNNTLKTVVTVFCFILIIVAFIVLPTLIPDNSALQSGLTILIAVFGLGGSLLWSVLTRKKIDKKMKEYFASFYKNINDFVFEGKEFENINLKTPGKIEIQQFTECGLYKDIIEVGSRGFTELEYKKIPFAVCDCAGNIKGQKRITPVFVGKYLFAPASYSSEEPVVIFLKGNDRSLPPTNVDEITIVEENEKMVIRSNNKDWKKVVNTELKKVLDEITTNDLLVDLAICVKNGRVFVLMGYDDPLMILPLMDKFDSKPHEQYKNDLLKIVKIVEVLNK